MQPKGSSADVGGALSVLLDRMMLSDTPSKRLHTHLILILACAYRASCIASNFSLLNTNVTCRLEREAHTGLVVLQCNTVPI